jgi:hypothetical protein
VAAGVERWSGEAVTIAEVEAALARLRDVPPGEGRPLRQRTSVMTHVAWVPPEWLNAASHTLEGMAQRHPSRTLILVPEPNAAGGIDAELSLRCFPAGDHEVCGEVIELHLRGDRVLAPASIVVPLAIADLPLTLRWRGEPDFAAGGFDELVDLADRLIVDSAEWAELRYGALSGLFERSAVSDLAWARSHALRVALAGRWPGIRDAELVVAGPPAEAALLRAWLATRLERELPPPRPGESIAVLLDGEQVAPDDEPARSPSDLLSDELEHTGRDRIYEQSVRYAAGGVVAAA